MKNIYLTIIQKSNRYLLLTVLIILLSGSHLGYGQCPTLTLSSSSGSACGINQVAVNNNIFGYATKVSLTHSGTGALSITEATTSPFSFTYTPGTGDAGNIVTITLITDNPTGEPCLAATASYALTVNALPSVSFDGTLASQCVNSTSFTLTGGSPSGGNYSGSGVSGTNFNASAAGAGTHVITYSSTDSNGCTNTATKSITVIALPTTSAIYHQ